MTEEKFAVLGVYDNEGETIDRYSVHIMTEDGGFLACSSSNPGHPQGVWSIAEGHQFDIDPDDEDGAAHLGKEIDWDELPEAVRKTVEWYFTPEEE